MFNWWVINVNETDVAIQNGHSRNTGNIGYTKHKTKTNKTKSTTQYVLDTWRCLFSLIRKCKPGVQHIWCCGGVFVGFLVCLFFSPGVQHIWCCVFFCVFFVFVFCLFVCFLCVCVSFMVVSNTYCVVLFVLFVFVLCLTIVDVSSRLLYCLITNHCKRRHIC
jgi:hypothetical protein